MTDTTRVDGGLIQVHKAPPSVGRSLFHVWSRVSVESERVTRSCEINNINMHEATHSAVEFSLLV